jgi:nucleoside-diphosphate-sugar epimerase
MTARVLVTGGAGFIGHHLVHSLLEDGAEALVVDDLSSGRRSHLHSTPRTGRLQLHEADVRQPDAFDLLPGFRPEIVYHLGAIHFIPYCNANPPETVGVNALGTDRLLRRLRGLDVRALIFASTAAVYGFADHPLAEDADRPRPGDVYGLSSGWPRSWFGGSPTTGPTSGRFRSDAPTSSDRARPTATCCPTCSTGCALEAWSPSGTPGRGATTST